jgi:pimeloyl-ACP methyl ester carboxylesterase
MDSLMKRTGMTQADVDRFRTEIVDSGALPYAINWYRALPLSDRSSAGTRVTVPTTMVWSDGDTALDRSGVDRTERCVSADYELVVLPGVSHWIPTHAPEALAEAVLRRVRSVEDPQDR